MMDESGDNGMEVVSVDRVQQGAMDMADEGTAPVEFPALTVEEVEGKTGYMRIGVPPNRYTPLKNAWMEIYTPIVEHMQLQIRWVCFVHFFIRPSTHFLLYKRVALAAQYEYAPLISMGHVDIGARERLEMYPLHSPSDSILESGA